MNIRKICGVYVFFYVFCYANVAESRRLARFDADHHTPSPTSTTEKATDATGIFKATDSGKRVSMEPLPANADFPHTADLRFARSIL